MYPDTGKISLPLHEEAPKDMPPIAFTYEMDGQTTINVFGEGYPIPLPPRSTLAGGGPADFGGGALPHNVTQIMRKGYYSAVSWIDYCIGKALDKLDSLGHTDDTVVALIGDHGWQLGEHNIWGKHTNFELGARVPLIFHKPGTPPGRSNMLVESVDLYPTVAVLAGLPMPSDVDGTDLSPIVLGTGVSPNKTAAFSEYPRCPQNVSEPWDDTTSCIKTNKSDFTVMGYSVRTENWRYTAWLHWDGANLVGDFSKSPVAVELYSHAGDTEADFDAFENVNLAGNPKYANVLSEHYDIAVKHWSKH